MASFHGTDRESIRRRLAELEDAAEEERDERRAFVRAVGFLIFWPAAAIAGMAWGFQMEDRSTAQAVFYLFLVVGDLGILGTLLSVYFRSG